MCMKINSVISGVLFSNKVIYGDTQRDSNKKLSINILKNLKNRYMESMLDWYSPLILFTYNTTVKDTVKSYSVH